MHSILFDFRKLNKGKINCFFVPSLFIKKSLKNKNYECFINKSESKRRIMKYHPASKISLFHTHD